MSVLDELKRLDQEQKKIDEQRRKVRDQAKKELLDKADEVIKELSNLGFNYRLVESGSTRSTGTRRTGIRQEVLATIKKHPQGVKRADLLAALSADDKSGQQSVSNALSALKKAGSIVQDNAGNYKAAS